MDYVREELLRQRTALERLMAGGAARRSDPETQEEAAFRPAAEETSVGDSREVRRERDGQEPVRRFRSAGREPEAAARTGNRFTEETEPMPLWSERGAASALEPVGVSARQVSRAIERDARRYDGGFTIY